MEASQKLLQKLTGDLSCLSRIIVVLATIKCDLNDMDKNLLESCLCPNSGGAGTGGILDQGFQETADASLTFLLKTSLAKNAKASATLSNSVLDVSKSEHCNCHLISF